jgi:protein-tyrosine phosphatase
MPTEILSGLWIGNVNDIYNKEFYLDNNINIVINCTKDQAFLDLEGLKKIRIPFSNDIQNDMHLLSIKKDDIVDFVHKSLEEKNIFIYCHNGLTNSVLIVALYMIKYGNISKDNIRAILRSKNNNILLEHDLGIFN